MTLKPNYIRAVATTYLWIGVVAAITFGINWARAVPTKTDDWLGFFLIGGAFFAVGVCVMFVPRELQYDDEGFSCRMILQGSHAYDWGKLEAYGSGNNVFLVKFEGCQAMQISGFGFPRNEWKEFKDFLKRRFPDKKCSFWIGPRPIMRKR